MHERVINVVIQRSSSERWLVLQTSEGAAGRAGGAAGRQGKAVETCSPLRQVSRQVLATHASFSGRETDPFVYYASFFFYRATSCLIDELGPKFPQK